MKIITFLSNEQEKMAPPEDIEHLIEICTAAALEEEGIDDTAEVSVTLVDNEGIRELNREHRDIDRETDVLSFPLGDDDGYEVDPDNDAIMLGDIVISLEKAAQQAEEYGHSYPARGCIPYHAFAVSPSGLRPCEQRGRGKDHVRQAGKSPG